MRSATAAPAAVVQWELTRAVHLCWPPPSYVSSVDQELCIACGDCSEYCQFSAIQVDNGYAAVEQEICMGCGICASYCVQEAITLFHDASRGEPLEIQKLVSMVN
jgi:heterodisulfide reductase subunit A-like polyferredoxin